MREPGERTSRYLWRKAVRSPLRRLGFDLVRVDDPHRRQTLEQAFQHLHHRGCRPATVIDVGVATGTPELYAAFPESRFMLIDPLREYESHLREIAAQVGGAYELAAASSQAGTLRLQVSDDPNELWNSTALPTADGTADRWATREVPAVRIDDLVERRSLAPPFLIKVDAEGFELEALRGAEATLQRTEAVVLEVNLPPTFERGPRLADAVEFMSGHGFAAYDIVGGFNRPTDHALALVDMVFMREHAA